MRDPVNLTHRLLSDHLLDGSLDPGGELHLRPDQVLIEDATGTTTYLQFEALGMERVAVPLAASTSTTTPCTSTNSTWANVVPVREVEGVPVGQVCVGSSVNSSYDDLARAAAFCATA